MAEPLLVAILDNFNGASRLGLEKALNRFAVRILLKINTSLRVSRLQASGSRANSCDSTSKDSDALTFAGLVSKT